MKTPTFKTLAITAIAGLTLAACATATPYQPAGYNGQRGGYAEQRLESDRYRVTFAGNSLTSREQVEMALLLRAAAARPKGLVTDVPALQRQLRTGLPMHEVVRRTACLGDRPADATSDEVFDWQDEQARVLRLHFHAGRLARIERRDRQDPDSAGHTPLQP
jgi:hypothetical protein